MNARLLLSALATSALLCACTPPSAPAQAQTPAAEASAATPQTAAEPAAVEAPAVAGSGTAPDSVSADGSAPAPDPAPAGDALGLTAPAEASAADPDVATPPAGRIEPETCTYEMYNWSVSQRRAVNHRTIEKPYEQVEGDERDPEDPRCTVCSEDQERIDTAALGLDVGDIRVCWAHRDAVERALRTIAESGEFTIEELIAYRPGRTRGAVRDDMRQDLSNHSYGTAIDINAGDNGLYRDCNIRELTPSAIAGCTLGVGGAWNPNSRPRTSITRDSVVYTAFTTIAGWRWGGEISGSTRDIMHFSLTGF